MRAGNPQYITVTRGLSGYFAVHIHTNTLDGIAYQEPWNSGIGRYAKYAEAEREGREWAEGEGLEFYHGRDQGDLVETGMTLQEYLGSEVLGEFVVVLPDRGTCE